MQTVFIEATDATEFNWGKFMVARFTSEEWERREQLPESGHRQMLSARGWRMSDVLVFDLQTGEGAMFTPGGLASSDLDKHAIWVCPMFEPFLAWLYQHDLCDLTTLPNVVKLGHVPTALAGYRRPGRDEETKGFDPWRKTR